MHRIVLGLLARDFLARGLVALCGLLCVGGAQAHSSGNSYLAFSLRDDTPMLRVDVSIRDLDFVFDLDGDRNGEVTWAETTARQSELLAWVQAGVQVAVADTVCTLNALDPMASQRGDGVYFSTEWAVRCPGASTQPPPGLTLGYGLMFDQDNLHRGLLKVELPNEQNTAILSPEQPIAPLVQGRTRLWDIFQRYVVEGVWHIWIGIDHILFLLSLLVLAPLASARQSVVTWQPVDRFGLAFADVLSVVTAFTVAHSITLGMSVMKWVQPPADLVEPVIALSVVLAALNNLLGWFSLKRWRLAFVFGLIHGFGFANVLLDLGLPTQALAVALGGFNVGVELGQLAIVVAFLSVAWWLRHTAFYRWVVVVGGSMVIAVIGAAWTWERLGF
jgi:hypothetical protein